MDSVSTNSNNHHVSFYTECRSQLGRNGSTGSTSQPLVSYFSTADEDGLSGAAAFNNFFQQHVHSAPELMRLIHGGYRFNGMIPDDPPGMAKAGYFNQAMCGSDPFVILKSEFFQGGSANKPCALLGISPNEQWQRLCEANGVVENGDDDSYLLATRAQYMAIQRDLNMRDMLSLAHHCISNDAPVKMPEGFMPMKRVEAFCLLHPGECNQFHARLNALQRMAVSQEKAFPLMLTRSTADGLMSDHQVYLFDPHRKLWLHVTADDRQAERHLATLPHMLTPAEMGRRIETSTDAMMADELPPVPQAF